ncbi:hypothetical protein MWU52_15780 [Jannaschia sp. S6380]|uniref:NfeD family protein n=1 Tax=Jannaschia sp. S6380 TaxID=2926408 RepID=UPI001FF68FAB|nr:hypothetical protein [Jannaschia sp. S6380]MCK0169015.1 hypothetical protein [Jannaschia sp. S6380]
MWAAWWFWAVVAVILAILEVVAPTYILLGFALGAAIVALGLVFGILGALAGTTYGLAWLLLIFALVSLVAWLGLRAVFGRSGQSSQTFDRDIND